MELKKKYIFSLFEKQEINFRFAIKSKFARGRKCMRNVFKDLENALLLWFQNARSQNFPIN